ncbi:MAG: CoA pyrophosphatase [Propionibacteriaceae bacterium]|nr:CoA pyrophosphatase [Propionibacteriaceae bacterium]
MDTWGTNAENGTSKENTWRANSDVPAVLSVLSACLETPLPRITENASVAGEAQHWAAVCALFSDAADPDILFTARAAELRKHPGQISFPGGARDTADYDPSGTALRETFEEVGLTAERVHMLGRLPATQVRVSRFAVVPMVAWWSGNDSLSVNLAEVAAVYRWPVSLLVDPNYRVTALHPSGFTGPAWRIDGTFLWGFTAHVVDQLLTLGGWNRPWDESHQVPVPAEFMRDHL